MLIDTPDFDSILEDNRIASESLLAVADLVVAVVTRHSYQNRAVVRFLERWLQHGRPWMLVYNEAIDAEVARSARRASSPPTSARAPLAALLGAAQPRRAGAATRRSTPRSLPPRRGAAERPLQALLFDARRDRRGEVARLRRRPGAPARRAAR